MSNVFDELEVRLPEAREEALLAALRHVVSDVAPRIPALKERLAAIDPDQLADRAALAMIPVLRKNELMERQLQEPPFGGFADTSRLRGRRIYQSPGPIWEVGDDRAEAARATARLSLIHI